MSNRKSFVSQVRAVKKVLVLGGGPAGKQVIVNLHKYAKKQKGLKVDVVLVDRREYTENTPSAVRAWVHVPTHDNLLGALNEIFPKYENDFFSVQTIVGEVTRVSPGSVHIRRPNDRHAYEENSPQEDVAYDALVSATGTNYPIFKGTNVRLEDRKAELIQWKDRVAAANHILIVGGGVVGVEIAGEILAIHPQKQVTIVHGDNNLLSTNNKYTQNLSLKKLLSFPNVKVLFGQKVDLNEVQTHGALGVPHEYRTNKDERITADIAVLTTGNSRPNTQMFEQDFPNVLTPQGFIKVLPTLQVEGTENIFALGDAANIPLTGKLAANITPQADAVAKNVVAVLSASKLSGKVKPGYTSPGLVIMGPTFGIMSLVSMFGRSPSGTWVSNMKTKVVFLGYKPKPVEWK